MSLRAGSVDRKDLSRIVFAFEDRIRRYFSRHVSNQEDIEDLAQDVICALMDSYNRFRGDSSVTTWVYAICRNHLYLYYRTKKRRGALLSRLLHEPPSGCNDSQAILDIACERLTRDQKKLFIEFYRNRRTIREIADLLVKPEGTVKFLLYELRRDLKTILG